MTDIRRLLSISEVSEILGVSRTFLYNDYFSGDNPLPTVRIGTRRLIRPSDLEQWIESLVDVDVDTPV